MNKKFLSAILFGALMVTSTGTFVSCKDYDDDIENLQTQIDKNSSAIAELQKLVGQGKWVSSISSIENGFTVTMSDGSSHQIKGINGKDGADGKDGKNGTEWTIGEDGFWYVDGEKTENVAVAKDGKDGKNGVTAPAPYINAEGMWVVYTFDAEKGEFVAETTEISAQGTNAYAVKAGGIYTLYIADENGELQEIALPATTDAFIVATPVNGYVDVVVENAKWNPTTSNKLYKKLAAEFPEIAELAKGEKLTQGGELPLIVSPANVELDKTFSFSLVDVKGKVADIELSNPTKGIASDWNVGILGMSRSVDAEAGLWTLDVTPAFDSKKGYASIDNGALIVTNAKGTSSRTAFAYYVDTEEVAKVEIDTQIQEAEYAEEIDVLAVNKDGKAIFTLENEYYGKYILEATNAVQREKYGIEIEGSKLIIGAMPANTMEIEVDLKMIALGLNGSVAEKDITLSVKQTVGASASLTEKSVTLGTEAQKVRWDVKELGMSALQFDNFMSTGDVKVAVTREADKDENDEVEKYFTHYAAIQFYNEKGAVTNYNASTDKWSNGEGVTFGFNVNALAAATTNTLADHVAEKWTEAVYTVTLISKNDETVVYSAETELTVENPALGADYVKLVPGFVDANGVYQITGTPKTLVLATAKEPVKDVVTYELEKALILGQGAAIEDIIDADYELYKEEGREDNALEMHNLVRQGLNDGEDTWALTVNQWRYKATWEKALPVAWRSDFYNQLYKTRNIRAMISLFGNPENVVPFDFQVEVQSELYAEKVTDAITIDGTKLVGVFGARNADGTLAAIDIKAAVTKAVSMAGTNKGKTYSLFATGKAITTGSSAAVINLSSPKTAGDYVLGTNGNIVTLTVEQYLAMCSAFNVSADTENYVDGNKTYKLKIADWNAIWAVAANYYTTAGNAIYAQRYQYEEDGTTIKMDANGNPLTENWTVKVNNADVPMFQYSYANGTELTDKEKTEYLAADKAKMAIYTTFKAMIAFNNSTEAVAGTAGTALDKARDARVESVTIKFNEVAVAEKYFTLSAAQKVEGIVFTDAVGNNYNNIKITPVVKAPNSVTGGQVKVAMTLTIRDTWGMIMNVPFEVTVKTSAN